MLVSASTFLITPPNPATWFYFSALLSVALFFKFTRLLSVRNLDVLSLFLLMPGLLLLVEGGENAFWGYVWLLGASCYYLARCLADLALVRRPALAPNLNLSGLFWLAGALFVSLVAVAAREPNEPSARGDTPQTPIDAARKESLRQLAPADADDARLRMWVERGLTLVCHLAVVVGLVLVGWRHFEDLHAGTAAATFYLLLPYTYLLLPSTPAGLGRWDHAWPMALMIWSVLLYRRPTLAGAFLGLAAGSVFFPALTFPVWFSFYWRRGACRFALSFFLFAGLCLAVISGLLWANGELPRSLQSAWHLSDWQAWKAPRPGSSSLWRGDKTVPEPPRPEDGGPEVGREEGRVSWVYRVPIFIAYIALVLTTAFWPSPKNLAHVLALSAAVLIGIQFWYGDRGGVYVLWYLPLLLLLIFRPNLSACQPAPPNGDLLARLGARAARALRRLFGLPEPAARVG